MFCLASPSFGTAACQQGLQTRLPFWVSGLLLNDGKLQLRKKYPIFADGGVVKVPSSELSSNQAPQCA